MKLDARALARSLALSMTPALTPAIVPAALLAGPLAATVAAQDTPAEIRRTLDESRSVAGSKDIKSYPILWEAYLEMDPPPMEVGPNFNHTMIHPGMPEWPKVSGWAESNPGMATAILACEGKTLFGLPYDMDALARSFREADLVVKIGVDGSLREMSFPYLDAIDAIAAYAAAESYRRLEAGQHDAGLDLAVANIFVLRQCCDREFIEEQLNAITFLSEALANLRDMFYVYRDDIPASKFAEIAMKKIPFLRPDRSRLLIPEGDKLVAEALIREVFDDYGQPDRELFASTFAGIQAAEAPLTRFAAARRWRWIADVHDSEEASLERLKLVYDDWWRRWRVEEYDGILDIPTQFERTNAIRYAAVIYSMEDMQSLFTVRNELLAQTYGTGVAAGLCGYRTHHGDYPDVSVKLHSTFLRKRTDRDPFDVEFQPFKYRLLDERHPIDTLYGRIFLEAGTPILYAKGQDHVDDRGKEHSDDGSAGDVVLWPPIKALLRENGMLD